MTNKFWKDVSEQLRVMGNFRGAYKEKEGDFRFVSFFFRANQEEMTLVETILKAFDGCGLNKDDAQVFIYTIENGEYAKIEQWTSEYESQNKLILLCVDKKDKSPAHIVDPVSKIYTEKVIKPNLKAVDIEADRLQTPNIPYLLLKPTNIGFGFRLSEGKLVKFRENSVIENDKPTVSYSLVHGTKYFLKCNKNSAKDLPERLQHFINGVQERCPTHLFNSDSGQRVSETRLSDEIDFTKHSGEKLSADFLKLVKSAIDGCGKDTNRRHSATQDKLHKGDKSMMVSELPLWVFRSELPEIWRLLGLESDFLTGHVDIVRAKGDNIIQILDLKPDYEREVKKGLIQAFLYSIMFSVRTGISLNRIEFGVHSDCESKVLKSVGALNSVKLLKRAPSKAA